MRKYALAALVGLGVAVIVFVAWLAGTEEEMRDQYNREAATIGGLA